MKSQEFTDEALAEFYDFARCQRPDGTFYGTGGVCRKGTPVEAKEKKAPKKQSLRARFNEAGAIDGGEYGEVAITKYGTVIKKGRLGQNEINIQKELAEDGLAPKVLDSQWTARKPDNDSVPRMGIMEMELASGRPYESIQKDLSDKQKAKAADEYLRIQAAMHRKGIAHGDLHEQNFFYDPATGRGTAIDFGLSKRGRDEVMNEAIGNQGLFGRGDWVQRTSSTKAQAFNDRRRSVIADMEKKGQLGVTGRLKRDKLSKKDYEDYLDRLYGDL